MRLVRFGYVLHIAETDVSVRARIEDRLRDLSGSPGRSENAFEVRYVPEMSRWVKFGQKFARERKVSSLNAVGQLFALRWTRFGKCDSSVRRPDDERFSTEDMVKERKAW